MVSQKCGIFSQSEPAGPGGSGLPTVSGAAYGQPVAMRGVSITYSLDSKGRVIREQHRKEDGTVVYERTNSWDGDRLGSAQITEEGKITTIEYSYDAQGTGLEKNITLAPSWSGRSP